MRSASYIAEEIWRLAEFSRLCLCLAGAISHPRNNFSLVEMRESQQAIGHVIVSKCKEEHRLRFTPQITRISSDLCVFPNFRYLSKCFAQIYRAQYGDLPSVGGPPWSINMAVGKYGVNIWNLLWLSSRLVISELNQHLHKHFS